MISRWFGAVLLSFAAICLLPSPAGAQAASAVAVGSSHACVITAGGGVKCWGLNSSGQLGVGTGFNQYSAVDVSGLTSGVVAIASGSAHTCAVTVAGGVKCWGENILGQLGDGTLASHSTPVDVTGLTSGIVAVAAGRVHTCALTAGGGVKCWGRNLDGQLGDGTTTDRPTPTDVSGLTSGVKAIMASGWHTCAVTTAGGAKCWGYNQYGELGDGTTTSRSTAVDVSGLTTGVATVTGGTYHSCALTTNGGAECWGRNTFGQLGDNTTTDRSTPMAVSGLTGNVAMLAAGEYRTCAVTSAGGAKCWGANSQGGVGDGTTTTRLAPVDVSTLTSGAAAIGSGAGHSCALTAAGGVLCWGLNTSGQVGDGTNTTRLTPVAVVGLAAAPGGGTITGTVTDASTGAPAPGVGVQVFSSTGIPASSGSTNASGIYTIGGLASGSYYLRTSVPPGSSLIDQVYPQIPYLPGGTAITSGTLVAVTAPATSNANFALARGGRISGTVINATTGQGVDATVWVYTSGGVLAASASTDSQGVYTSPGLPGGTYFVRTSNTQGLVDEAFNDLSCPGAACSLGTAVPVAVTALQTTLDVDFVLAQGGRIGGTVTNATGSSAALNVVVTFFSGTGRYVGAASTDSEAAYTSPALAPGTYFVRTNNAQGLADQVFNGIACPAGSCAPTSGTPVTVSGTGTVTAVNFALAASGQPGGATISPGAGPTTGQTLVTIVGSGFWSDATTVSIGGQAATSVNVASPNMLTAVAPPGAVGTAAVSVTTPAGTLAVTGGYLYQAAATMPPFGQVDTPVQHATGVVGTIGVTGWALDDVGVTSVKIYRNCLASEPQANCQIVGGVSAVYIGDAAFLAGARPDVEQGFSGYPNANRAGWGYLMLTNMLPHVTNGQAYGGQGELTFYAFATDAEGQRTLLGRSWSGDHSPTTVTLANETIAKPFGAIDTPGQGQMVRGVLPNFGWVLTSDGNTTADAGDIYVPWDGSTIVLYIDGQPMGPVSYGQCRGSVGNPVPAGVYCDDDISSIFGNAAVQPTFTPRTYNPTRYRNLDAGHSAIGAFVIDTRTLANGMHTIAWGVIDSAGRTEGIGSRFFTVLNSVAADAPVAGDKGPEEAVLAAVQAAPAVARGDARLVERLPQAEVEVEGRVGFGEGPLMPLPAGADGVRVVRLPELSRLELRMGPVESGYLVANGTLRDLPPGSRLDEPTGVFTWGPPAGYVGTYRLTFVAAGAQIPVAVTIGPRQAAAAGQSEIRMHLDLPRTGETMAGMFQVAGWALDPQAPFGAGIGAVHVWAERTDVAGAAPVFLGAADLGGRRPDVGRAFGRQYEAAGFGLTTSGLAPGRYELTAYAWNVRTARWEDARAASIVVR